MMNARPGWRAVPLTLAAILAGCAPVQTFVNQSQDLASGQSGARVQAAQVRQDQAREQNVVLQQQLADVDAEQARLKTQIDAARVKLQQIKNRINAENRATDEQRQTYQRLVDKQGELQRRLASLSSAPPAQDSSAAIAQQQQLDQLSSERATLEKQVDALQRAL
jgi:signal transduction protein with GAF and PtsI domain